MFETDQPSFHVLRFMKTLKAARDFGLEPEVADAIALRFDPRVRDSGHFADALATALIEQGVLQVPESA